MTVSSRKGLFAALLFCSVLWQNALGAAPVAESRNAASDVAVIADPHSGLALFGYDPVAYHVDRKAIRGKPTITAVYRDAVWQFTSVSNRAAFLAAPDDFMPAFSGYDAQSVSEGRMTSGDPETFMLLGEKLVLFRSRENLDHFARDNAVRQAASARWHEVVRHHGFH